ncbi:MAG TPA: acetylxylan esterase [Gammaproteobacteria bacterium]
MERKFIPLIPIAVFMFVLLQTPDALPAQPVPVALSSEQDHARMMKLLNIQTLRRWADWDPASPHAANFDESKANEHLNTLPDVLVMANGDRVKTQTDWWQRRRPELVALFEREIYGRVPDNVPEVTWKVLSIDDDKVGDLPVIRKKLSGKVDNSAYPLIDVDIELTLTLPAKTPGEVPVLLALSVNEAFWEMFRQRMSEEQFNAMHSQAQQWKHQVVKKGWAYAELIATSVQADDGAGLTRGIIGLVNKGQPRDPGDWGALRAWAWGASRALDYFDTDKHVDADRVAVHGHSRYGKAALVAMAFDRRFAAAYISSSGEAGAKLWRRNFGEQVGNIAGSGEYHWMAGNFLKYAGPLSVDDLPVDAHQLIALCAPRPVFIGAGNRGDEWVDPKGMFLAALHADPVYRLLGAKPIEQQRFPPVETALTEGELAFRQHNEGHTPAPNWEIFLTFVDRYF